MLGIYSMTTSSEQTVARDSRESIEELADLKAEVLDARIEDSIILIDSHAQQESKIFMIDFVMEDGSTERVMYSQEGAEFDEFIPKEMTRMKTDAPEIGAGEVSSEIDLNDFGIEESKIKSASFLTENGNRFTIDIPQVALQSVDDGGGDGSGGDTNTDGDGDPWIRIIQHDVGEASVIHGTGMVGTEVSVEPYIGVGDTTDFAALIKEGDEYNAIPIPEFFREYDLNNGDTLIDLNPPQGDDGVGGDGSDGDGSLNTMRKQILSADLNSIEMETIPGGMIFSGTGKVVVELEENNNAFWISGDTNGGEVRLLESDFSLVENKYNQPCETVNGYFTGLSLSEISEIKDGLEWVGDWPSKEDKTYVGHFDGNFYWWFNHVEGGADNSTLLRGYVVSDTRYCDTILGISNTGGFKTESKDIMGYYAWKNEGGLLHVRETTPDMSDVDDVVAGIDSSTSAVLIVGRIFKVSLDEVYYIRGGYVLYSYKTLHTNIGTWSNGSWGDSRNVHLECTNIIYPDSVNNYYHNDGWPIRIFYDPCRITHDTQYRVDLVKDVALEGNHQIITGYDMPDIPLITSNSCDGQSSGAVWATVNPGSVCFSDSYIDNLNLFIFDTLPGKILNKWNEGYFEENIILPGENKYLFVEVTGTPITIMGTLEQPIRPNDDSEVVGNDGEGGTEDKGDKLIDIINAPTNTPYQIIYDGRPVVSGMSSPDGKIVVWGFENTGEPKGGMLHLYENSLSDRAPKGTFVFDDLNQNTFHLATKEDLVYTAHTYVAVDVSVDTAITDISLESTHLPENTDRVKKTLTHIEKNYVYGETAYIPVIPGYDTINLTINGVTNVLEYGTFLNIDPPLSAERESTIKRGNPFGSILSTEATTGVTARFVAPSNGNLIASIEETISGEIEIDNDYVFTTAPSQPTFTETQNPLAGYVDIYVNGVWKKTVDLGVNPNSSDESGVSPAGQTEVSKTKKYTYTEHDLDGTVSVPVSTGDFVEFYVYAKIDGTLSDYTSESHELVSKLGHSNTIVEIKSAKIIPTM